MFAVPSSEDAKLDVLMLDLFLGDLDAIREGAADLPRVQMLLRWKRSWSEKPLATMMLAREQDSTLRLYLFPVGSAASSRAAWWCFTDPLADVTDVAQASRCTVTGHLEPGRAVSVATHGIELLSTSPMRVPFRGPRRGPICIQVRTT